VIRFLEYRRGLNEGPGKQSSAPLVGIITRSWFSSLIIVACDFGDVDEGIDDDEGLDFLIFSDNSSLSCFPCTNIPPSLPTNLTRPLIDADISRHYPVQSISLNEHNHPSSNIYNLE
jgi:hypothetical protein